MGRPCVGLPSAGALAGAEFGGTNVRRKIRRKFTWFPTVFTQSGVEPTEGGKVVGDLHQYIKASNDTDQTIVISPVTLDAPRDPSNDAINSQGVLADQIAGDYVIERIVGKVFCGVSPILQEDTGVHAARCVEVAAGFFVARVNDSDSGGGIDAPIGSATPDERNANYSPLHPDAIREPWMWRRTWLLSTQDGGFPQGNEVGFPLPGGGRRFSAAATFPNSNAKYGSVMDGPHFDCKSVRRVRNDERLFFVSAVWIVDNLIGGQVNGLPGGELIGNQELAVVVKLDLRLLGALRRARNKSNF